MFRHVPPRTYVVRHTPGQRLGPEIADNVAAMIYYGPRRDAKGYFRVEDTGGCVIRFHGPYADAACTIELDAVNARDLPW